VHVALFDAALLPAAACVATSKVCSAALVMYDSAAAKRASAGSQQDSTRSDSKQ
jgi:hypothetical protein